MQCSPTSVRTPLNFKFTDFSNRPRDILVRRFALYSVHIVGRLQWKSKNLRLVWSSFSHLLSNFDPLGKMGKPLVYEIWQKPATSCIIGICSAIWFYIQKKNIGYANVGLSYDTAVEGHYWRLITSAFSHISVLHLVFNMSALWSLGVIEQLGHMGLGVEFYLQYTLVLVILSGLLVLGSYHVLIQKFKLEYFRRVTAVGYSAVVFGWMTILSVKQPSSKLNLFGVLSLPISFAPFESLIFTSIIVPQASFVGHLSGIIVGYSIAWGLIHGMSNYWAISMLGWTILVFVLSLKRSGAFDFSFIEIELVQDLSLPTVSPFAPGNGRTLQMDALPV